MCINSNNINSNDINSNNINLNDISSNNIEPINKSNCLKIINEIASLEENFNDYNAKLIPIDIINQATQVLDILEYEPFIVPTGRQTIQFEYHIDKHYLEFEIFPDSINILICHYYEYEHAYELNISKTDKQLSLLKEQLDFFFKSINLSNSN